MVTFTVLGTFDTKGEEHRYVADRIREHGHAVLLIDVGTLGPATLEAEISREEVAREAGADLAAVVAMGDPEALKAVVRQHRPDVVVVSEFLVLLRPRGGRDQPRRQDKATTGQPTETREGSRHANGTISG